MFISLDLTIKCKFYASNYIRDQQHKPHKTLNFFFFFARLGLHKIIKNKKIGQSKIKRNWVFFISKFQIEILNLNSLSETIFSSNEYINILLRKQ